MKRKGFSLIEILIISFIIVSLAAMVAGIISRSKALSRAMVCMNNLRQISIAIESYQADWKASPVQIYSLFPNYLKDKNTFKCPDDHLTPVSELPMINSYGNFYINRSFVDEDTYKLYLYCTRHFSGTKAVGALLSYSANIVQTNPVMRNGSKIKPGEVYSGGTFTFVDGTVVNAESGVQVGLCGSFVAPDDRHYSIIYIPEGSSGTITVEHQGDSRFEVISPAFIAGVSGTRFTVNNVYDSATNQATTTVNVIDGAVVAEDRVDGTKIAVNQGKELSITVECQEPDSTSVNRTKSVPVKPKKRIQIKK